MRPHIENYSKLSLLYQIVTNAFSKKVALIKDLMRKTEDLVKRTATGTGFELAMKVVRIDENTVEALKTEKGGEPPKVINLGKSLLTAISEEANNQPYLIPIGERTEAILEWLRRPADHYSIGASATREVDGKVSPGEARKGSHGIRYQHVHAVLGSEAIRCA